MKQAGCNAPCLLFRLSTYIPRQAWKLIFESMNPQAQSIPNSSIYLLGAILNALALSEVSGLSDYSIKALVGGCIWLVFKILSDYISLQLHKKEAAPKEDSETLKK